MQHLRSIKTRVKMSVLVGVKRREEDKMDQRFHFKGKDIVAYCYNPRL